MCIEDGALSLFLPQLKVCIIKIRLQLLKLLILNLFCSRILRMGIKAKFLVLIILKNYMFKSKYI